MIRSFGNNSGKSFSEIREQFLPTIEKKLSEYFADQRRSSQMSAYQMTTGGKRFRALIPLFIANALEVDPLPLLPLGLAAEVLHNATLVHDDLQDGDEFRRGQPTVWKKFSSAQAINCGDALFQHAFLHLIALDLPADRLLNLSRLMVDCALEVIEGQCQELALKSEQSPNLSRYLEVARGKTSGLFVFPIVGVLKVLGGFSPEALQAAHGAALDLGVLFQVRDDFIDLYGQKGRAEIGADIAEGKISFFVAHCNEVATTSDQAVLKRFLGSTHKEAVLEIFQKYDAKNRAIQFMKDTQSQILSQAPAQIRPALAAIAEVFLN